MPFSPQARRDRRHRAAAADGLPDQEGPQAGDGWMGGRSPREGPPRDGWMRGRSTREGPHHPELSVLVPTQVGDGKSRTGHARAAVRAPRLPGHRRPLDEAAGFLPEAQTHQQPPRPLRTCKYRRWEEDTAPAEVLPGAPRVFTDISHCCQRHQGDGNVSHPQIPCVGGVLFSSLRGWDELLRRTTPHKMEA